eukprot:CAMPEP_0201881890 /NCGR_PEP_ID=MMETSP0902-20130614/12526_1 /ASSEMBLY_ACC=CAM_ASM_000551 /TAXON_ID=420261 /ORGANISM="Thalassiosira antarctica, Strain CCMP982" /LENGTH=217 /DNA_ID=CAMNT_0048410191 /DNA_START=25 /DNA_END=678 /DNA_ORIENTATION=+
MNLTKCALLLALAAPTSALELSSDNYEAQTAGKSVFLKFFAPWCGHCKKLKPDWDKLMDEFSGSSSQLVADVDCTAEGKPLCDANGVKGYPTLKYGDPSDLQDYKGGRSLGELKTFVEEELKPLCSVSNIDLCDADKKAEIEGYMGMTTAELEAAVAAEEKKIADAEEFFKAEVQKLQDTYSKLNEDKEKIEAEVKSSGLGLMKSVLKSPKAANDEL